MNVSLFIRKSHPSDDEMIGAVQQRDGQYIIPVSGAHTLDANTAEHLRRHGGFVSVRKTELVPYVGRRMQNARTEAFEDVTSVAKAAELVGLFYHEQFGFSGGVFESVGRPGRSDTSGRSYRFEATAPAQATSPVPLVQAEAAAPSMG